MFYGSFDFWMRWSCVLLRVNLLRHLGPIRAVEWLPIDMAAGHHHGPAMLQLCFEKRGAWKALENRTLWHVPFNVNGPISQKKKHWIFNDVIVHAMLPDIINPNQNIFLSLHILFLHLFCQHVNLIDICPFLTSWFIYTFHTCMFMV